MANRNEVEKIFDYTAEELKRRIDDYFDLCDGKTRKATYHGLIEKLDIIEPDYERIIKYVLTGECEDGKVMQRDHSKLIYKSLLRLLDALQQRTDTNAIFILKQKFFGFSDKLDANLGEVKITIGLTGMKAGEDAFK
jgi:hypothetical protein